MRRRGLTTPATPISMPENTADCQSGVFAFEPGQPFLDGLARAILRGDLPRPGGQPPDPLDLPAFTLLLPTRRAARALGGAFLKASGRKAVLLPKVRTIAERDDDEAVFATLAAGDGDGDGSAVLEGAAASLLGELPPLFPAAERLMVLMQLVTAWRDKLGESDPLGPMSNPGAHTPAQVAVLARDLAALLDLIETEGVSLAAIRDIVPDTFSSHWDQTLDFLKIITEFWPAHQAASGQMTAVERRNRLLRQEAERLRQHPPKGPVIVAGVTGSIPATVALMDAVLALASGAVVLPGYDGILDDDSYAALAGTTGEDVANGANGANGAIGEKAAHRGQPDHPQFALQRLLRKLGVLRRDIHILSGDARPALESRARFVSQAMRPTETTDQWHAWLETADPEDVRAGLADVHLIEAASALEEAEAIALILRECVETPGKTAALVTPDRLLARRVAIRLAAWGIRVDDSAGRPFAKTVPGAFLDLVVACSDGGFQPDQLMALLKHPLCRLSLPARDIRLAARALELMAFRTVYTGQGLGGVRDAVLRFHAAEGEGRRLSRAAARLSPDAIQSAHDLVDRLEAAFAPLTALSVQNSPAALADHLRAHLLTAEVLSRLPDEERDTVEPAADAQAADIQAAADSEEATEPTSSDRREAAQDPGFIGLYDGEAGQMTSVMFAELIDAGEAGLCVAPKDYADLYRVLVSGRNVLARGAVHPQIAILGVMEARLIDVDVMILGGLNDGTWPDHTDPGPWLNRPMRRDLGLPELEEKIGYAAHDFVSFLETEKVYLTRALKVDGVPTVASRWLLRMKALLGGKALLDALATDRPWLAWARLRDHHAKPKRLAPPRPAPPVLARPRQLGVSKVETLMANPYAVFAERILGLEPLPDLGLKPDASLRGMIVHAAMSAFAARYPDRLPDDIADAIMAAARDHFDDLKGSARVWAFWRPRLQRFARWFAETEPARRQAVSRSLGEVDGSLTLSAPAGPFKLTARADRIDVTDGGLIITDYKTGQAPGKKDVAEGRRPQLPLEAAIALAAGFGLQGESETGVAALRYIRATGGEPPGEELTVAEGNVAQLAENSLSQLGTLIARFDDAATPYAAVRRSGFTYDFDPYAQLARVAEWSATGDDGGEA